MDLLTSNWPTLITYAEDRGPSTPTFVPVRISVGAPRWVTWAKHVPKVSEITPYGLLSKRDPLAPEVFDARYLARLEKYGPEQIGQRFDEIYEAYQRPLVLLCWEPPGERCHRRTFADWWHAKTGQKVPETLGLDADSIRASLR